MCTSITHQVSASSVTKLCIRLRNNGVDCTCALLFNIILNDFAGTVLSFLEYANDTTTTTMMM